MRAYLRLVPLLLILVTIAAAQRRPLVVVSVDGLDHRYLRDADKLGLRIPTLRRLMKEGALYDGVTGIFPTVTWPSHTTMITGVRADEHGILSNRRPASEGGDYYWFSSLLKAPTLWQAAAQAGLKTAAITWPVTVGAGIDYNLPEAFRKRRGGGMDLSSIQETGTPGLVEKIAKAYPTFPQEFLDDRTRTLAAVYMLRELKPDLLLLHLVDHDAEAHDNRPFRREANAAIEYTDELIAQMIEAAPPNTVFAITSDHGFEHVEQIVNLPILMKQEWFEGVIDVFGPVAVARDERSAGFLRRMQSQPESGVGREVPKAEVARYTPRLKDAAAVFEPAPHRWFGTKKEGPLTEKPHEPGMHGFWPTRPDFRASLLLWGKGIKPGKYPETDMLEHVHKFAEILELDFPSNKKPSAGAAP